MDEQNVLVYALNQYGQRVLIGWHGPHSLQSEDGQRFADELWQQFIAASKKKGVDARG